jgi:hypothetical protein
MLQMQDKMSKKYRRSVEVWVPVLFDSFLQNIRKCYDIEIYVFLKPFVYTFDMQRQIFVSCINAEKVWVKDSDARIVVYRCLLATRYIVDSRL